MSDPVITDQTTDKLRALLSLLGDEKLRALLSLLTDDDVIKEIKNCIIKAIAQGACAVSHMEHMGSIPAAAPISQNDVIQMDSALYKAAETVDNKCTGSDLLSPISSEATTAASPSLLPSRTSPQQDHAAPLFMGDQTVDHPTTLQSLERPIGASLPDFILPILEGNILGDGFMFRTLEDRPGSSCPMMIEERFAEILERINNDVNAPLQPPSASVSMKSTRNSAFSTPSPFCSLEQTDPMYHRLPYQASTRAPSRASALSKALQSVPQLSEQASQLHTQTRLNRELNASNTGLTFNGCEAPLFASGRDSSQPSLTQKSSTADLSDLPVSDCFNGIEGAGSLENITNGICRKHGSHEKGGSSPNATERGLFYKIKLCPWYREKRCNYGEKCCFAHSQDELRPAPNLVRMRMCPSLVKRGTCPNRTECNYAHDIQELQKTPLYKTELCRHHRDGQCAAGEFCRYAHGSNELRKPSASPLFSIKDTPSLK